MCAKPWLTARDVWHNGAMPRPGLALALVALLAGTAAAQAPSGPPDSPAAQSPSEQPDSPAPDTGPLTAAFLEDKVTQQLTAQGVALSRRNLAVQLDRAGEQWTASLVDAASGRVAASIKLDPLPAERDAAVAAVARAVAGLADQVGRRINEFKFQLLALRFDPTYDPNAVPAHHAPRRWLVFRGRVNERLDVEEFYKVLGRADLLDEYEHRRNLMYGGYAVGALGFATAVVWSLGSSDFGMCDGLVGAPLDRCTEAQQRSQIPTYVGLGLGLAGALFGTWFYRNPQPIDESDARTMADAYNQQLRRQLGSAEVRSAPRLSEVRLAPYAGSDGAGLALGARF
jgi:hypothetical protein